MVLEKYILNRFFRYLLTINISITFLFNFIEFFEKIIRVKHATINMVLHFIILNIPPSFFQNINVSIWLTTCLLLKEFIEQNEWETFKILNINYQKLFQLFLYASISISLFTFIGKENITLPLLNKSEKFKYEQLKQTSFQKIHNKWLEIKIKGDKAFKTFSFFQFLDLKDKIGTNLILININKDFEVEKIISSKKFKVNLEKKILKLKKAISVKSKDNIQEIKIDEKLYIPSFFSQLQLSNYIPPISLLLKNIIFEKKLLPKNVWFDLIAQLLKRLFFYLQIILYPILTLFLFLTFENKKYKWISIFLSYPIMILTDLIVNFFANQNYTPIYLFIPYLLIIMFILLYKKRLAKNSY